jgi:TolB protein
MKNWRYSLLILIFLLWLVLPAASAENGKIAFNSYRDGNSEIYEMNADGTEQTRITTNPDPDDGPAWSPDGTKIAFASTYENGRLYTMNADGSGRTHLMTNLWWDDFPDWSPDGTKIAFASVRYNTNDFDIYVTNTDGTGQTRLTTNSADDVYPAWSPDGTKIAFESFRNDNLDIYVINSDGTGETRLTTNPTVEGAPDWSPDGTKIAFASVRDGYWHIYVMNADGTAQTRITTKPSSDNSPAWSPDGTKIAFDSWRDDNLDIYVINSDGTGETRLTTNPAYDNGPAWGTHKNIVPPKFLTLPFIYSDVKIQQGWNYNFNPPKHEGIDYILGNLDQMSTWKSFPVVAAAGGDACQYFSKPYYNQNDGKWHSSYGNYTLIRHEETDSEGLHYYTLYGHLNFISPNIILKDCRNNDFTTWTQINRGDLIGFSGITGILDTGCYPKEKCIHLHFEVNRNGYIQDRTDPYDIYNIRDYYPPNLNQQSGFNYLWTKDPPVVFIHRIIEGNIASPGELRVIDSQSRITGLVNGEVKIDIPNSAYFDHYFALINPSDSYKFTITGTEDGTYGLDLSNTFDGNKVSFTATNLPISRDAIHQFTIDWNALSPGNDAVTLQIDANGDGTFEKTVTADKELTRDEYNLQTATNVKILPRTINLASKGRFIAFVKLPNKYNVAGVDTKSIFCEGAPAERVIKSKKFPHVMGVIFQKSKLKNVPIGDQSKLTIIGKLNQGGQLVEFKGSDTIKVINNKANVKEELEELVKLTEDKIFENYYKPT